MKSPSFDIFQDNFSFRNLGYGLLRCALATMIVVAAAFLIWCLPTALTWLQQTLAVYGMTVSVDVAWTVTLLQSALVFSAALVVWTIDGVVQAWQQGPTVHWSADQLIVVPEAEGCNDGPLGKGGKHHLHDEIVKKVSFKIGQSSSKERPTNSDLDYGLWGALSYFTRSRVGEGELPFDSVDGQDDQIDQDVYDGLTKRVSRRLIFDPIKRVSSVSHGPAQRVATQVMQALSQQLMKPGLLKNNGLHIGLQKWLQSGVLSYSQKVLAYQLWLSAVPVPGNYLRLPAQVVTEALGVRQKTKPLIPVLLDSNHAGEGVDKNRESANPIENDVSTNFELDASSTTPVAPASSEKNTPSFETSPSQQALSANTQDDKEWWEELRTLLSPKGKDASTDLGAEISEDLPRTPVSSKNSRLLKKSADKTPLSKKVTHSPVSITSGLKGMFSAVERILWGGSFDGSKNRVGESPDFHNRPLGESSYGPVYLDRQLSDSQQEKKGPNNSLEPLVSDTMIRSPLLSSLWPSPVLATGEDENACLGEGLLGSPIRFSDSPRDSLKQGGSPFNNVAFMTWANMSVAEQFSDDWSRYEDLSGGSALKSQQDGGYDLPQAEEIMEGSALKFPQNGGCDLPKAQAQAIMGDAGLEWQQDSRSRDDIDLLAVDLDAGLQCGQTISPIMLGNSSLFVKTKGEGDPACEASLDDIDEAFSGISIIKVDHKVGGDMNSRFDSPSATKNENNSIWAGQASGCGYGTDSEDELDEARLREKELYRSWQSGEVVAEKKSPRVI